MKNPIAYAREMALQSMCRLGKLAALQAPEQVVEHENKVLDRHLAALGRYAEPVVFELVRERIRILGQEAMERAWEARCDRCSRRCAWDPDDDDAWERWCTEFGFEDRPMLKDCPHFTDKWPC